MRLKIMMSGLQMHSSGGGPYNKKSLVKKWALFKYTAGLWNQPLDLLRRLTDYAEVERLEDKFSRTNM